MNVESVNTAVKGFYLDNSAKLSYGNAPAFFIPEADEPNINRYAFENGRFVDAVSAMEAMTGKISASKPSYSITEEEAEYFREKYGEEYNEEKAAELYYELADKGIISRNDAFRASGVDEIRPLTSYRSITYIGGGDPYGLGIYLTRDIGFVSDKVYVKDVSRTDKDSPYKILWDNFKKKYDLEINTWKDALQENIDYERYVKKNKSTADYVFQQHSDKVIEGLEKTKDIISQIFD
ncbi:MAG: hypothetical protein K2H23_02595 [Oscillospiraceae bacterium]|nr:hypothetical protein [Oscillospiraceae bacterium]